MAIEFKYKGTTWRADTAEEAVALRNELAKSDEVFEPVIERMEAASDFWTPDKFMEVINGIGPLQHRFLAAVRHSPRLASSDLVRVLKLDSDVALAGVISGLSKQLKNLGIEPKQVFQIDVNWKGKVKTRRFILEDFFAAAGNDQNWPDAWEGKGKVVRAVANTRATKSKSKSGQH